MKRQVLAAMGINEDCLNEAQNAIQAAGQAGRFKAEEPASLLRDLLENPLSFAHDPHFSALALKIADPPTPALPESKAQFRQWGQEIDAATVEQMRVACSVPVSVAGAIMPDGHLGYGVPIGGVLATEGAVIPYAVGVDIACRMKLSIFDLPAESVEQDEAKLSQALQKGTVFGVGGQHVEKQNHPVFDQDWNVTKITRTMKDRAWLQLGSSGSGNHFAEFGVLTLQAGEGQKALGLEPGRYLALLSHSGSRGAGAAVCKEYSAIARGRLDKRHYDRFKDLAWLYLDSQEGQEYWAAMNLMGDYAAANHAVLHQNVAKLVGAQVIAGVENHHNFAWKETHGGKEVIVHRKGATPAGKGVLGVIPGSMADPCYVVLGKGQVDSLESASHGAGRRMSRTAARAMFNWPEWRKILEERKVKLLSAGLDEVPGSYKNIRDVMAAQGDLVDVVAEFFPRIVKMSDDGTNED